MLICVSSKHFDHRCAAKNWFFELWLNGGIEGRSLFSMRFRLLFSTWKPHKVKWLGCYICSGYHYQQKHRPESSTAGCRNWTTYNYQSRHLNKYRLLLECVSVFGLTCTICKTVFFRTWRSQKPEGWAGCSPQRLRSAFQLNAEQNYKQTSQQKNSIYLCMTISVLYANAVLPFVDF